ncbi:MAG: hypothetical protein CISAcid_14530 [uncultured Acidilobus sp. CIS]|nr:MAG: hypothetical protein CISAcid_14530 [uncultured Acidilobus sp. CIS]
MMPTMELAQHSSKSRRVSEVTRTVVVRSAPLPRRAFKVFVELEGMYRNMVEQLVLYAVNNGITKFTRLKAGGTAR